jgi:ABC-type multidrug transport system fused ATPase/permease subunit
VAITGLFVFIGIAYLRSSVELKRLESISRSPIFQHFGETLNGVSTIRAYGDEQRFIRENLRKINDNNRPFMLLWVRHLCTFPDSRPQTDGYQFELILQVLWCHFLLEPSFFGTWIR